MIPFVNMYLNSKDIHELDGVDFNAVDTKNLIKPFDYSDLLVLLFLISLITLSIIGTIYSNSNY